MAVTAAGPEEAAGVVEAGGRVACARVECSVLSACTAGRAAG